MAQSIVHISVRAIAVSDNGNGTFDLQIPGQELTVADQKVLEQLFPNLLESAHRLLNQEALLASIASPSEVIAPKIDPTWGKDQKARKL